MRGCLMIRRGAWLLKRLFIVGALAGCTSWPTTRPAAAVPPALVQSDTVLTLADGVPTPARVWAPAGSPRAVVLALHGFNDSRDAYALPGPVWAADGLLVVAPDQRGFGAASGRGFWPGGAQLADDAAAMLGQLRRRYPGVPLFALGQSMGGAVLMTLATRADAPAIDGWILLSPAVWGRAQQGPALAGGLFVIAGVAPGVTVTGGEVPLRVRASDNRAALLALVRNPLTIRRTRLDTVRGLTDLMDDAQAVAPLLPANTLLLYGEHDMLVPAPAMRKVWRAAPANVRRAVYPAGWHLLVQDLGRAGPIADIAAWIRDPAAWLPSGADFSAAAWAQRGAR